MMNFNVRRITVAVLGLAGVLMSGPATAAAALGGLDPTFGSGGIRTDAVGSDSSVDTHANDVAVQPDGKIVVAVASSTDVNGFSEPRGFTLVRYNPDGTRDRTFGTNGVARAGFRGWLSSPTTLALQPNGKIVVAGSAETEVVGPLMAVARFGSDGRLDRTFSGDGRRLTEFDGCWGAAATGLAVGAGGRIIVGGSAYCRQDRFAVVRYTARGALDRSFSGDGKQTIAFRPPRNARHADARGYDLALQPDGKVIIVGNVDFWGGHIGSQTRVAVARLRADGNRDLAFGSNGVLSTRFGTSNADWAVASSVALRPSGKIVVAVRVSGDRDRFGLARYRPNGMLDSGFGDDGRVVTRFGTAASAYGVASLPDGKVIAVGASGSNGGLCCQLGHFTVARYTGDGSLDDHFGVHGVVVTSVGVRSFAYSVAIQTDGGIVAVGAADTPQIDQAVVALVRYSPI
jgi:uncharacterized delta-60 repeat protein